MSLPFRPTDRHDSPCWLVFPLLTALWGCTPEGGPVSEARVESVAESRHAKKDVRSETAANESADRVTNLELIQNPTAAQIQKGHDAFTPMGAGIAILWEMKRPPACPIGRTLAQICQMSVAA